MSLIYKKKYFLINDYYQKIREFLIKNQINSFLYKTMPLLHLIFFKIISTYSIQLYSNLDLLSLILSLFKLRTFLYWFYKKKSFIVNHHIRSLHPTKLVQFILLTIPISIQTFNLLILFVTTTILVATSMQVPLSLQQHHYYIMAITKRVTKVIVVLHAVDNMWLLTLEPLHVPNILTSLLWFILSIQSHFRWSQARQKPRLNDNNYIIFPFQLHYMLLFHHNIYFSFNLHPIQLYWISNQKNEDTQLLQVFLNCSLLSMLSTILRRILNSNINN